MTTLKFAIAGASGRMGRMLIETVLNTPDAQLVGALDIPGSPHLSQDPVAFLGKTSGIKITSDIKEGLKDADFLIDFTRPEGTLAHLEVAQTMGVKMIIGTTGFNDVQKATLKKASEKIAIVFAPNMSVGVNATFKLLEVAAKILNSGYDIEIVEAHHKHKVDAPSGTAIGMGEVIAKALGKDLKDCAVYAREGHTGERE
ncbi:MAG: dihydrodipicolinate reductase, partial [Pseudomonadota bacterium]